MDPLVILAGRGYLHEGVAANFDLQALASKPFCFRLATEADLDALLEIERNCWQELSLAAVDVIHRLRTFPGGQWAATVDGQVIGVMYTQRLTSLEVLTATQFDQQSEHHVQCGSTLQLLGVAVLPQFADLQISGALRDFVVRLAAMDSDIMEVVAMTRCSSASASEEEYFERVQRGDDPTLQFHAAGGARVVQVVKHFRTNDLINFGHAVLIRYDLGKKPKQAAEVAKPAVSPKLALQDICDLVNDLCDKTYHSNGIFLNSPFMDLGLDSLRIMEFRARLAQLAGVEQSAVPHSVVFDYPTPQKLLDFINTGTASELRGAASRSSSAEDVLVCGVSCRLPGGANDARSYFNMLREGCCMIQSIPPSWKTQGVEVPSAGLLDDSVASSFDPVFFGISSTEAQQMDPHQRLLLEVSYEALVEADVLQHKDTMKIGVFVGLCNNEWIAHANGSSKLEDVTAYTGICTAQAAAANRVSYTLGLSGPSMVVDTACSSSLAALHVALLALKAGDCEAAVVAAADLLISPYSLKVSY